MRRQFVHVPLNDAGRNADIFRVGAVIEQQVVTQILKSAAAKEAFSARCRIRSNYTLADMPAAHVFANRHDIARQLMTKQSRAEQSSERDSRGEIL